MTHAQHEAICEILTGPLESVDRKVAEEFLAMAWIEADHLEPLIDEMIEAAYQKGFADGTRARGAA